MEDCYFFYNSDCSKGSSCPFRHEPSALRSDVVCSFWLQGYCSKVPCPYRHAELPPSASTPCYWESRPGGCRKTACSFLHSKTAAPILPPPPSTPKIIVNKNKINEIGHLIAKQIDAERIVIPEPKPSVKDRLGVKKKLSVKDRLGSKASHDDNDQEEAALNNNEEEELLLREKAIMSLDLRKRLIKNDKEDNGFESEEADVIVKSLVTKVKKVKKKKKKKKSSKRRHRSRHSSESSDSDDESKDNENECLGDGKQSLGLAARVLRDLKTTERKRKSNSKTEEERSKKSKRDSNEQLFVSAVKEMESINEAISESNDVLKELEDLINN